MKNLKHLLIHEIISQLEILAPDIMKAKGYVVTKTIQLTELTIEQLEQVSRTYWQQIEAKTNRKVPYKYKYEVDFRMN